MVKVKVSLGLALNNIWIKPKSSCVEEVGEVYLRYDAISVVEGLVKVEFELILRIFLRNYRAVHLQDRTDY